VQHAEWQLHFLINNTVHPAAAPPFFARRYHFFMFAPPHREKERADCINACACTAAADEGRPAGQRRKLIIEGSGGRINVSIGFISSRVYRPALAGACINIYVCALWFNANWVTCLVPLQAFWLSERALFYSSLSLSADKNIARTCLLTLARSRETLLMKKCVCFNARHASGHLCSFRPTSNNGSLCERGQRL